ncbi:MAG TPA: response regulator [Burkholderiales bacterium]|nr:response regulator [Burkholderiales bacterium]
MNEGGHFSLSVRADERDALITVVDDGSGISGALLQRALELALNRRPGERAYTVRIPLDAIPRPASAPPLTYGSSPRRRILVVDDNIDAGQSLAMLLRELGHDVQVAHDGNAALEAVRINRPQLVLLDLSMPGVDGYRVVMRLKSDPQLTRVRFVAVTGSQGDEARCRCREAGFDEYLVKPVAFATLRELLARL